MDCAADAKPRPNNRGDRPRSADMCEMPSTLLSLCRSGRGLTMLPPDPLTNSTVYDDFTKRRGGGTLRRINNTSAGAIRGLKSPN